MMIQFTLAELQQLIADDPGSSLTDVQQRLHLSYSGVEVTTPAPPQLTLPQTIKTLTIGSDRYTTVNSWRTAWLREFESNIQQGLVRRQSRYVTVAVAKANVRTARGNSLETVTVQPSITPTNRDTTTIVELEPQRGAQGEPGPGVILVSVNEVGNLIVTYEDQSTTDAGYVIGPPPVITTGPTTTVDYGEGSSVTVTNPGPGTYNLAFTVERSDPTNPTLLGVGTLNGRRIATQPDVIAFNLAF